MYVVRTKLGLVTYSMYSFIRAATFGACRRVAAQHVAGGSSDQIPKRSRPLIHLRPNRLTLVLTSHQSLLSR